MRKLAVFWIVAKAIVVVDLGKGKGNRLPRNAVKVQARQ